METKQGSPKPKRGTRGRLSKATRGNHRGAPREGLKSKNHRGARGPRKGNHREEPKQPKPTRQD